MKKFLLFLFTASLAFGEIIPITSLKTLEKELKGIDQQTWVVFDVDMTLIVPKEPILWGSLESVFFEMADAVNPSVRGPDFYFYRGIILRDMEWELLTPEGPAIIRQAQEKGAKVIALTAMGHGSCGVIPSQAEWRREQLFKMGIDFSKDQPNVDLPNFYAGILFSDRAPKGQALVELFDHLNETPSKVIFIDDRLDFITSVDESMTEAGIPVVCYHFKEIENRPVVFTPSHVRAKLEHLFDKNEWLKN